MDIEGEHLLLIFVMRRDKERTYLGIIVYLDWM